MSAVLDNDRFFFALGAMGYVLAFASGLPALFGRKPLGLLTVLLVALGWVFQSIGLYQRGIAGAHCPIGNPFEVFQFITWALVIMYGLVGPAFRTSLLGVFCSALAGFMSSVSLAVPGFDAGPGRGLPGGYWIEAHASLSLFSYGAFGLLAVTSTMYLLQAYGLKHRRWESIYARLPSLVALDSVNLRILAVGVAVYTVAIGVGVIALQGAGGVLLLKLVFAVAVWLGYTAALVLRLAGRLFAQALSRVLLVLFGIAILTLYPVELNREAHRPLPTAVMEGGAR